MLGIACTAPDRQAHRRRVIHTFVLSLAAFLTAGTGVLVLIAPGRSLGLPGQEAATRRPDDRGIGPGAAVPVENVDRPDEPAQPDEMALVPGLPSIPRPDQPSRLVIPGIALDARVVEVGIVIENGKPVWETAAFAVGFHRGTALPGTRGNAVVAGHISSPVSKKGEVFKRLPEIRIGDRVDTYVSERRVTYEVSEIKVVPPTAVQVIAPTPDATLTLITCYPDRTYANRLVVVAKLVDGAA